MDAATQEAVDWVLKIAGAAIAILPLVFTVALIKGAKGIVGAVAGKMQNSRAAKGIGGFGDRVGDNVSGRRRLKATAPNRKGIWGSWMGAGYRMSARSRATHAGIQDAANKAEHDYTQKLKESDPNFAAKTAGGLPALERLTNGLLGAADPVALQRALAGARFSIEKAEADEIKAEAATISNLNEAQLNDVIHGDTASDARKAAALERLAKVGTMESIQRAVDTHGTTGQSTVMSRTLANALQENNPGFLKASDIDNIGRGQMGSGMVDGYGRAVLDSSGNQKKTAASFEAMVGDNLTNGVMSQEKMVGASKDALEYASGVADNLAANGDMSAVNRLQQTANDLQANRNLSGKIKNNAESIEKLGLYGTTH